MVTDEQLRASRAIQRRTGRTFHVATRFLPERARYPTYVLYAFFRVADEVVDDPDPGPPEELRAELARLREAATGERETDDPVLAAFDEMRERHGIPDREVEEFVAAMEADVEPDGYDTYEDLRSYLRGSSVAVAYMMLAVMDPEDSEAARPHARALAEAFQLTNFLRDVREDVTEYGRIYIPRETLQAHGASTDDIADLRHSAGVTAAVRAELRRTEERYREGVAGIEYLPEDCQFPVLLSAVLYAEHHRLIRERGYDVVSATPSLGLGDYLRVLARTWWHWRRERDPEAAFYRASAVSREAETDSDAETDPPSATPTEPAGHRLGRALRSPLGRAVDILRS
ncbi:phytoene/squalene synthase family protein [Halorussus salilacus]|uniref:phytoene/squalene synthase family protein n=1 Tax=Halorussus salilacus TaxID=2953750 RepID=UPI00209D92DF|nr:phytoene/squalene synthase family protein [Halorussus salilacus]USZ67377.1 phytoene/squalene synthase family protein [Halorussus salilacus]